MAPIENKTTLQAAKQIARFGGWSASTGDAFTVTYGFRATAPSYNDPENNNQATFSRFTSEQKSAATLALQLWADVANIRFDPVNPTGYTDNAAILFGNYWNTEVNAAGYAKYPHGTRDISGPSQDGDVWINSAKTSIYLFPSGGSSFRTILHEVGHAIGLAHPGEYDADDIPPPTYDADAIYIQDSRQYTIMSYFQASETGANHTYNGQLIYASTPLLHDIAALQRLYGANMTTRTGDTVYGFNSNAPTAYRLLSANDQFVIAIWDAGGNDTLDFSGYATDQIISLKDNTFSSVGALTANVAIAKNAVIENAKGGSGNDIIFGNWFANSIWGNDGSDTILGDNGDDHLYGGVGTDYLYGGPDNDVLVSGGGEDFLYGDGGVDTADYSFTFLGVGASLDPDNNSDTPGYAIGVEIGGDSLWSIENLIGGFGGDALTGSRGNNMLSGLGGDDFIYGGRGNDTLYGGGDNDFLFGEAGNDILDGGAGTDYLDGGPGSDTADYYFALSGVTIDLGATGRPNAFGADIGEDYFVSIENAFGGWGPDTIYGNSRSNRISGREDNDHLYGRGGDDIFIGDQGNDIVDGGNDTDTIDYGAFTSAITVDLSKTTVRGNGTIRLWGTGQGIDAGSDTLYSIENVITGSNNDIIIGSFADNLLNGGPGDDRIDGRFGSDTVDYSFATAGVRVDLDQSLAATLLLTVGPNSVLSGTDELISIENIIGGSGNDELYGDDFDNVIAGGLGNDVIDGRGGIDTADYSSSLLDIWVSLQMLPSAYGGVDTGQDYLYNIENVRGGYGNDTISGNELENRLEGGFGNDYLYGNGGNDTFVGGRGDDYIDGGNDIDTLDYSAEQASVVVSLATRVVGGITILNPEASGDGIGHDTFLNESIENVFGGAAGDILRGSRFGNWLVGNDGDDSLFGLEGNDILTGGAGNDYLHGGDNFDTADYSSAISKVTANIASGASGADIGNDTFVSIEALLGGSAGDDLTGDGNGNIINGGAGADYMAGLGGNDWYYVDSDGDVVSESAGAGDDMVFSFVSRLLDANVEHLALIGTEATGIPIGGVANINGTGNELGNFIYGNDGNNILNGGGGNDALFGGLGNDILTGGADDDGFGFQFTANFGNDHITDFRPGLASNELISFSADQFAAGTTTAAIINNYAIQLQNGVQITTLDGSTVILDNVQKSGLDPSDFLIF